MAFGRFVAKTLFPTYYTYRAIKNMKDHGVVEGIKQQYKEDLQDNPVTNHIYSQGKHDGKKEGFNEASYEFEKKLIDQARRFTAQTKIFEDQRSDYEELLNDYERYIAEMEAKSSLSPEQQQYIKQIVAMEQQLKNIGV